jgi:hypothetical protein
MWLVCQKEDRDLVDANPPLKLAQSMVWILAFVLGVGRFSHLRCHQRRNHFCHSHGPDIDGRLHEMATQRNVGKHCRRSGYCQRLELWAGTRHLIVPDIDTERFVAGHHPR